MLQVTFCIDTKEASRFLFVAEPPGKVYFSIAKCYSMNCTLGIPVYDEFLTYDFLVNIEGYTASFYNNYPIFAGSDFAARWHEDNELLGLNEGDLVFCKIVNELNDLDINKKYAYGTQLTVVDYDSLTKFIIPPRPLIKFIGIIRKYDL